VVPLIFADIRGFSFDQWLNFTFSRDPQADAHWLVETDYTCDPTEIVRHCTTLFLEPSRHLSNFSEAQVQMGLGSISSGVWGFLRFIWAREVEEPVKDECIRSMYNLFAETFESKFPDVCFFWWDQATMYNGLEAAGIAVRVDMDRYSAVAIPVMERILMQLRGTVVRKSALLGLAQLHIHSSNEVERVIGTFLDAADGLDPQLRDYAEGCRFGDFL
jgi:hypothetical protein